MTTVYVIMAIIGYLFIGGVYAGYDSSILFYSPDIVDELLMVLLWPIFLLLKFIIFITNLPYKLGKWLRKATRGKK